MTGFDELNDFDNTDDWGDTGDWQSGDDLFNDDSSQMNDGSGMSGDMQDGFSDEDIQNSVGNTVSGRSDQSFTSGADNLESNSKADTAKAAVLVIILGVIILLVALIAWRILQQDKKDKDNTPAVDNSYSSQEQVDQNVESPEYVADEQIQNDSNTQTQIGTQNEQSYQTSGQNVIGGQSDSKWQEFNLTDSDKSIVYNEEYSPSEFTITNIKNYVCISDADSSYIRIKTTLSGQISGCPGVYELDVPYSIGQALKVGQRFDVQVLYGTYDGRTVVGDIRYY